MSMFGICLSWSCLHFQTFLLHLTSLYFRNCDILSKRFAYREYSTYRKHEFIENFDYRELDYREPQLRLSRTRYKLSRIRFREPGYRERDFKNIGF